MRRLISKISIKLRRLHKSLAKERVLVLGDSHVAVFDNYSFIVHFPFIHFEVISVGGATASGLENPRSKTQAYKIFENSLEASYNYDKIIVMLGEVDTGFVIWYRAKKYNTQVDEMLQKTIETYTRFIKKLHLKAPTIVISTPLPTIDDQSVGEVANARKEIDVSQKDRTLLTLEFNRTIKHFCEKEQIPYIDLDNKSLGKDGIVKEELKNKDVTDHHYNFDIYAKMLISELKKVI